MKLANNFKLPKNSRSILKIERDISTGRDRIFNRFRKFLYKPPIILRLMRVFVNPSDLLGFPEVAEIFQELLW